MHIERKLKMNNDKGLFAKPATDFVTEANRWRDKINITYNGQTVDAKNLIAVFNLHIGSQSEFTLSVEGSQAEEALASLEHLINSMTYPSGFKPPWNV
jgi:phosphotransferase system HPr (HPr) family protein